MWLLSSWKEKLHPTKVVHASMWRWRAAPDQATKLPVLDFFKRRVMQRHIHDNVR
jgi:hypothetical protein